MIIIIFGLFQNCFKNCESTSTKRVNQIELIVSFIKVNILINGRFTPFLRVLKHRAEIFKVCPYNAAIELPEPIMA